jgi:hypothetical protein
MWCAHTCVCHPGSTYSNLCRNFYADPDEIMRVGHRLSILSRINAASRTALSTVLNCGQKQKFSHTRAGSLYSRVMKTAATFVTRCGTPGCEWSFHMPGLGELALECC